MNREDVVLLVSRALACIQAISALFDLTYLPERLLWLHHYVQLSSSGSSSAANLIPIERVEVALYFGRIAILVFLTFVFWNCGPRIARFLLPERKNPSQPSDATIEANNI